VATFVFRMAPGWEAKVRAAATPAVDSVTERMADDCRRYCPVDTGELRDSIEALPAVDGFGQVRVGTDHWRYVEYGTRNMSAQPFMRPALYQNRGSR
jgi:HK97 gp10 family phage protein